MNDNHVSLNSRVNRVLHFLAAAFAQLLLAELRQVAAGATKCSVDVVVVLRIGLAIAVSAAAKFLQKSLKARRVADAFGRVQEQIAHELQEELHQYELVLLDLRPVAAVSAAQFSNRVSPIEQAAVLR
jgi:hypothetical protein